MIFAVVACGLRAIPYVSRLLRLIQQYTLLALRTCVRGQLSRSCEVGGVLCLPDNKYLEMSLHRWRCCLERDGGGQCFAAHMHTAHYHAIRDTLFRWPFRSCGMRAVVEPITLEAGDVLGRCGSGWDLGRRVVTAVNNSLFVC
jgi:hypothetical protein